MIILDTKVLSEMMRPFPSAQVLRWAAARPPRQVFTTTITQAEILCGIDGDAAVMFAKIAASLRVLGRPQVAAIARSHGPAVATRDTSDFEDCGITVVSPWIDQ